LSANDLNRPGGKTLTGAEQLASLGVKVGRIERPTKEKEAQQVLAEAFQDKRTVIPCGGGTAMGSGTLPETADIALDMTGMNRVLAFDPQNLNIAVLAGMTLDAVNEFLSGQGKGFFLPLDPPLSRRATIGGVYAANSSGPSRLHYGTVRDQALGVRGADAMGREIGFGGKTVKNVSGYDLTKFFVGSAGSLGLITSISFRVQPLPEAASLGDIIFETVESLDKFLAALRSSILVPSAVTVTEISPLPAGQGHNGPRYRVLVGFEGAAQAIERQNRDLLKMAQNFVGVGDARMGREEMMRGLRSVLDPEWKIENLLALKISVPISKGAPTLVAAQKFFREKRLDARAVLFPGNGILLVYASGVNAADAPRLLPGMKDLGKSAGGFVVPLSGPRDVLAGFGPRVEPSIYQGILKPLKEKLDPAGVFPPMIG